MPTARKPKTPKALRRRKRRRAQPYHKHNVTPMRHAKRRHGRSKRHHGRMLQEARLLHTVMSAMLKKQHDPSAHYDPRHFSKDPEYTFSDARTQAFKRSVPAPDVHFWRPQGPGAAPHRQNFNVRPTRPHPHAWRFIEAGVSGAPANLG